MSWKPIKSKAFPLYKQIASYIEARILAGEYPPGMRLPSERELAQRLNVNRSTINIAFEELKAIGLVKRVVGAGTIVNGEWGAEARRLPNWDKYVKEGVYSSNNPVNQKIYQYIGSDETILNFGIGELSPDLSPINLMKDIPLLDATDHFGYEHLQGNEELRGALVGHMFRYRNINSTSSSILITSGAQQALHLIIRCLLKPGDSVAIEDPSYAYSLPIFHSEGLKTYRLPVEEDGIDPEQIVSLYQKQRIKMIFLNPTYQNPTGTVLGMEKKKRILEVCSKYGIAVVEDDPYSLTGYEEQVNHPLYSLDHEGIVLYISSLSKIIGSGLRIGWIVGPQNVIDRLTDAKQQIDFGQSFFPQWLAKNLIESKKFEQHIHSLRTGLKIKRDIVIEALQKELSEEITFITPKGGIHLWCQLNNERIDEQLLFKQALHYGMVFAPGSTLGSSKHHLRLTYSRVDSEHIHEGIDRFVSAFKSCF